ncbi:MAG: hypothetical protein RI991_168, partial [Bacteroidota bacterium]
MIKKISLALLAIVAIVVALAFTNHLA